MLLFSWQEREGNENWSDEFFAVRWTYLAFCGLARRALFGALAVFWSTSGRSLTSSSVECFFSFLLRAGAFFSTFLRDGCDSADDSRMRASWEVIKFHMRYACREPIAIRAPILPKDQNHVFIVFRNIYLMNCTLKFPADMSSPWFSLKESPYQKVRTERMIEASRTSTNTILDSRRPTRKKMIPDENHFPIFSIPALFFFSFF